ncbi:YcjX family protein [Roseospira navarrensis]|nr:YcjX family protein [Roseospira navarrensis]
MKALDDLLARRIYLGVTGLSRAGKTVFVTSLIHNLLRADASAEDSPLRGFDCFDEGRLIGAMLRHDANATVPEFPYRKAMQAITGESPQWPEPTRGISRIRIDLRYRRTDAGLTGQAATRLGLRDATLQLEIVDYPGEWLVDLPLLGTDFETWSAAMIEQARQGTRADLSREWLAFVQDRKPDAEHDEDWAEQASALYADYLRACSEARLRNLQPGRFLHPADLRGASVLRFCPLPDLRGKAAPGSIHAAFRDKFRDYQEKVVRTFYRQHFAGLDRQIVLVDALSALNDGQEAFDDQSEALAAILQSFRHGRNSLLGWLMGRRISKVLFAATKADHVIRGDRLHLENLTRRMLHVLDENNAIKTSAETHVQAIASVRATRDTRRADTGREILVGRRPEDSHELPLEPGAIPLDFPPDWAALDYRFWDFQPHPDPSWKHSGFPTLRLPEVLNLLIGDDLT